MKTLLLCSLLFVAGLCDSFAQALLRPNQLTPETAYGTRSVVGAFDIGAGNTPTVLDSVSFKITLEKEHGHVSHLSGIEYLRLLNLKTHRFISGPTNVTSHSHGLSGSVTFDCSLPIAACDVATIGVWAKFTEKYPGKSRFALTLNARDLVLLGTNGVALPSPPEHTVLVAKTSAKIDLDLVAPCGKVGDIDGDGLITEKDYDLVGHYAAGLGTITPDLLERLDVNGDGRVTISDWVLEANYLNGIISVFPACTQQATP